ADHRRAEDAGPHRRGDRREDRHHPPHRRAPTPDHPRQVGRPRRRRGGLLMSPQPPNTTPFVPLDVLERIDKICAGLAEAWRAGPERDRADSLGRLPEVEQKHLLPKLLQTDLECRQARGLPATLELYLARLPEWEEMLRLLVPPAGDATTKPGAGPPPAPTD